MLAAGINVRVSVNVRKRHFYRRKPFQPFHCSSNILGIPIGSFKRSRFGLLQGDSLQLFKFANHTFYRDLRIACFDILECTCAIRIEENCLLSDFIPGHLVTFIQCIRGGSLV